ncbi:MAG: hypothetical protein ACRDYC_02620 [Acidimicrobiales bacterium]
MPEDWTDEIAGRIESVVGAVRDRTTRPATTAAKAIVYGLVAVVLGGIALTLLVLAILRVVEVYLPVHPLGRRVWITYAGLGAIFLGLGLFLWSRRRARKS